MPLVPASEKNDMIFSIICEEMGAAGAIFLIFLFAMLLWRLGVAAMHAKDLAGALICCGIMGHLALQVILNIAVVTNDRQQGQYCPAQKSKAPGCFFCTLDLPCKKKDYSNFRKL